MVIQPNDILLAFKHIGLSDALNGTEKQFGAFLIDSFNRKTGRCDPSEETAAFLLRKSSRTIIRAGNRLVELKLFVRRKHAGHNHCNSYLPNWQLFREAEDRYKLRRRERAARFARPNVSPSECQPCHLTAANSVTQTSPKNNIQSTYPDVAAAAQFANVRRAASKEGGLRNKERDFDSGIVRSWLPGPPSSRQAAEIAAERRWNKELLDHFIAKPYFATIVEQLDAKLQGAATDAEMGRRGAGLACILQELARRGLKWS